MHFQISIFIILLIFAATEVKSEEVSAVQTSQIQATEVAPEVSEKKISLSLTLEHSSNLNEKSNPDRDESTSLIIQPKYIFSEKSQVEARMDIVKSYDSEGSTKTTNTIIIYTPTKIDLSKELSFEPQVAVTLPTDQKFKDDESYRGSLTLRPTLLYSPSQIKGLNILNRLSLSKNFHEYEINNKYSPNVEYSLRYRLGISYAFTEKLMIELVNDYSMGRTYNSYNRDIFYFAQSIGYEFTKNWTVSISHKNEGPATGPGNSGSNIAIYDTKSSYLGLGVSHVF